MTTEEFYRILTAEINRQVEPLYGIRVTLIRSDSQGDFHWFYENIDGVFNQGTFNFVSARVSPGDVPGTAQISPAGGFPNACIQVVTAIYYALSREDEARLQKAVSDAAVQATVVIQTYQGIFGQITAAQMSEGQAALGANAVSNKQDYVIGFVMGYLWSGRRQQNQPVLVYTEMAKAPDLSQLLPYTPQQGSPVLVASQKYLNLLGPANALEDQVFLGGWTIAQLRNNTARPDDVNGGMKTVDPNTGGISNGYQVGYGIGVSIAQIQGDLNDTSRVIHAEIPVSGESPLRLTLEDGSEHELLSFVGMAGQAMITIDYPGFTLVPTGPKTWLESTNTGWFDGLPIAEANRSTGPSISGFRFTVPPAYNLGLLAEGGDFGLITHLLISDDPIVTIHGEMSLDRREKGLQQEAFGRLGLFGRPYSVSYSRARGGGFTLLLTPARTAALSPLEQTAYVIGGAFDFPGVSPQASWTAPLRKSTSAAGSSRSRRSL